ncbi:MAG: NAD-dependent epimerase/dehydratase family protein [Thaumarchaeota archaeon]|nr:NAD-dependent epimerase/dehydratase family protein [Nitrososphaerota archaeon]
MSKVAVTGGAGFLGSHVVRQQLAKGNEVAIIDNFSSGFLENLADLGIKQVCLVGDLHNYDFAKKSLAGAETVYHFAAEVGSVQYLHGSADRELDALQTNLVIDANVFKACRENKVNCIIYPSSVSVYPFEKQLGSEAIFKEDDATEYVAPEGGYGWSKYLGEVQLNMMPDVSVCIARIFHAYGENIYLKPDRSQVIASLISKAIRYPKEEFVVWGDGHQKRCFVFIDDLLEALKKLESFVLRKGKLTVNLGSQEEVNVRKLAEVIIGISGKNIKMRFDNSKPTGALSRKPDLQRIQKELDWIPKTRVGDGLVRTYNWAEKRI